MVFRFTVTERDPSKPWLILGTRGGLTLEAEDAHAFRESVQLEWPPERFEVQLEPGELMRALKSNRTPGHF